MNPRPRTPLAFNRPFTRADALAAGHTAAALRGWRERQEVFELAPGVFAPISLSRDEKLRRIWTDKAVAQGRAIVPVAGAAAIHKLWVPPHAHASLQRSKPVVAVPEHHLLRLGPLVVPDRAWTAVALGRGQRLEGALIALDCALRLGESRDRLRDCVGRMQSWPGIAALQQAVAEANGLSGSALESWSRGLMVRHELPTPTLQHPIDVQGRRLYPDFIWLDQHVIGEADGQDKYGIAGAEVFAEKRRQAKLQAGGYMLYRWGWPEVRDDPSPWLHGLSRLLGAGLRRR